MYKEYGLNSIYCTIQKYLKNRVYTLVKMTQFTINQRSQIPPSEILEIGFKSGYIKEIPFRNTKVRDECYIDLEEAMMFQVPAFSLQGIVINVTDIDYVAKGEYY